MTIYVFRSGAVRYGYTLDATGANLPQVAGGPWRKHSSLDVADTSRRVGIEAEDVRAAIGRYGYAITGKLVKVVS